MKILLTGNGKHGLSKDLYNTFSATMVVDLFSRTNGYDLNTEEGKLKLIKESINYDIFINCSKLNNFNQTLLLKGVWDSWVENNKKGIIINIGSTVDTGLKGGSRLYTVEKVALKNMSRKLSLDTTSGNGINVCYLSLGYLDTEGVSFKDKTKISLEQVTKTIAYILLTPQNMNINEISIDAIQEKL